MTPDRLARMVEREKMNHLAQRMPAEAVLKLLRRQHKQFVRLMKMKLSRCEREHTKHTPFQGNLCKGYKLACNEVLAALQRGRR